MAKDPDERWQNAGDVKRELAPEQLEGKEADARTDIFAFGAMLYEMAAGRKAFDATSSAKPHHTKAQPVSRLSSRSLRESVNVVTSDDAR